MAAVGYRTWCRTITLKHDRMLTRSVYRYYAVASSKTDEGVLQRVKKFVFGETVSPEQLQQPDSESYYQIKEVKSPPLFNMEPTEIKDKLQSITRMTLSISAEQNWLAVDTKDMITKYKILKHCSEEFGLEIPSHQLKDMNSVHDIVKYYSSIRSHSTKTFESIDLDNLPPNLQIGGKVPRKQV